MNDPFSALDVQTHALTQIKLLDLWSGSDTVIIFVTYDFEEVITLADRIMIMTASPTRIKDVFLI